MTPPTRIGAVVIPRPWESEGGLLRFQGADLAGMDAAGLERERARLQVALGLATDAELGARILGPIGAAALTVERWLIARLEIVEHILADRGGAS